jgi:hypothetical protein
MRANLRWSWALSSAFLALGCAEPIAAPADKAEEPPTARKAECRWAPDRIRLDGVLDEKAWGRAQAIAQFAVPGQKRKAASATTARLLWDGDYLYFSAEMDDRDLYAHVTEDQGMTWTDDVFELFFKPAADKLPYYEFQVNAANARLELFFPSRGAGGYTRFAAGPRLGLESAVRLKGTLNKWEDRDEGWIVEGRIPWTAFKPTGGRPKAGDKWKFALCRYDYSAYLERPELSSSAPLTEPDFHRYEDYGELTFVGP